MWIEWAETKSQDDLPTGLCEGALFFPPDPHCVVWGGLGEQWTGPRKGGPRSAPALCPIPLEVLQRLSEGGSGSFSLFSITEKEK